MQLDRQRCCRQLPVTVTVAELCLRDQSRGQTGIHAYRLQATGCAIGEQGTNDTGYIYVPRLPTDCELPPPPLCLYCRMLRAALTIPPPPLPWRPQVR